MMTKYGDELKRMKIEKHLEPPEMAKRIGVSTTYLQKIIDGRSTGSIKVLMLAYLRIEGKTLDEAQRCVRNIAHQMYEEKIDWEIVRTIKAHRLK